MLFGVEASYLAAWSALVAACLYSEFIARWSSVDFAMYVEALGGIADRYPDEGAQRFFNEVLVHERECWQMSWQA